MIPGHRVGDLVYSLLHEGHGLITKIQTFPFNGNFDTTKPCQRLFLNFKDCEGTAWGDYCVFITRDGP